MTRSIDYYKFAPEASALLRHWDPIGVYDDPEAPEDEYDSYVPGVVGCLIRGDSVDDVTRHLGALRRREMGLDADVHADRSTAAAIVAAFERFKAAANES